jgi:hypothetical protein
MFRGGCVVSVKGLEGNLQGIWVVHNGNLHGVIYIQ